jgi:hypothetical protein
VTEGVSEEVSEGVSEVVSEGVTEIVTEGETDEGVSVSLELSDCWIVFVELGLLFCMTKNDSIKPNIQT